MIDDPRFNRAIETVLKHEGGLVDDPKDPGGITNFGISLRWLQAAKQDINGDGKIDRADIKALTKAHARQLYYRYWWRRYQHHRLGNLEVATKVLDLAVVVGPKAVSMICQRASCAAGRPLKIDGIMGPLTRAALNELDTNTLLAAIRAEAAGYFRVLAADNPVRQRWLNGWLARAYD